jgi:WD40 repeat protein
VIYDRWTFSSKISSDLGSCEQKQDGNTKAVYRGPTAPVTCVAIGGPDGKMVFAGSWDKCIWSWELDSKALVRKFEGHTDFVKAVVCAKIGTKDCLISGGADKKIIVWDVGTGARIHTLQDSTTSMLAIQDLVIDPLQSSEEAVYLVSASSDPHIRRWKICLDSWEQTEEATPDAPGAERRVILEHETTVYKLVFDYGSEEVDLWSASGDGTAKCLSRLKGFASDDSFQHGAHVRAVAVTERWVITAGRDEDLKLWDRASGKLRCSLEGHYDEVTDLVILRGPNGRLCSVSIDGTIRTWPLDEEGLDTLVKEQEQEKEKLRTGQVEAEATTEESANLLTADEEAELAKLLDDE